MLGATIALVAAGCGFHLTVEAYARERAVADLRCREDQLRLTPRPGLSNQTYDVDGCGRHARYTCFPRTGYVTCWEEPLQ